MGKKKDDHLAKRAEREVAKDEIVVGETALVPPKYHFFIISTTFSFSTFIFDSSSNFPSLENPICTNNTQPN